MVTISVALGGGQESEGGWRADAEETTMKGGRKRGECRKKGQEEDGDHPRTVENSRNTVSQNLNNGEVPRDPQEHLPPF